MFNNSTVNNNYSSEIFDLSRKVNIYASINIVCLGFIGNLIIIIVFSIKKFRSNSGQIYLFCLSISDNLFLIVHLLEDTLRTYRDVYSLKENKFLNFLDFIDKSQIMCQSTNYFRNLLRFISAYIVLTFTIQRLFIIFNPLTEKFKEKKSAWISISTIIVISMIANSWVPFFFKINLYDHTYYCDIDKNFKNQYFLFNMSYIIIVLIKPITTLLISNSLIICRTIKYKLDRKKLERLSTNLNSIKAKDKSKKNLLNNNNQEDGDYIKTFNQNMPIRDDNKNLNSARTLTTQLLFISFKFFILNLPYMIIWCLYFYKTAFYEIQSSDKNHLFSYLQIAEIFYIFNYSSNFFILLTIGSTFRVMLKNICNLNLFFFS